MVSPIDHELRADFMAERPQVARVLQGRVARRQGRPQHGRAHPTLRRRQEARDDELRRPTQEVEPRRPPRSRKAASSAAFPAATSMLDDFAFYGASAAFAPEHRAPTRRRARRATGASGRDCPVEPPGAEPNAATPPSRRGPARLEAAFPRSRSRPGVAREKSPKPRADAAPFDPPPDAKSRALARTAAAPCCKSLPRARAHTPIYASARPAPIGRRRARGALPPFKFGDDDRDQRAEERRSSPRARVAETRTPFGVSRGAWGVTDQRDERTKTGAGLVADDRRGCRCSITGVERVTTRAGPPGVSARTEFDTTRGETTDNAEGAMLGTAANARVPALQIVSKLKSSGNDARSTTAAFESWKRLVASLVVRLRPSCIGASPRLRRSVLFSRTRAAMGRFGGRGGAAVGGGRGGGRASRTDGGASAWGGRRRGVGAGTGREGPTGLRRTCPRGIRKRQRKLDKEREKAQRRAWSERKARVKSARSRRRRRRRRSRRKWAQHRIPPRAQCARSGARDGATRDARAVRSGHRRDQTLLWRRACHAKRRGPRASSTMMTSRRRSKCRRCMTMVRARR